MVECGFPSKTATLGTEPIDGTKLKAAIGDQYEIPDGIDNEPGRQGLTAPEMQKNRNQSDLLGNSQHHLEETCRPPVKQSSRAAWARTAHSYSTFAGRIDWLFGQGSLSGTVSGLPAQRKDVDR